MNETQILDSTIDKPEDYQAAVVQHIQKIDHIRQQMAEDQKEIDRLKSETREILDRLEAA